MGRTLPTTTQQLNDTEAALARFRRTLRKSDQYIFDGLFAAARRHTVAISQIDALLPFEPLRAHKSRPLKWTAFCLGMIFEFTRAAQAVLPFGRAGAA
ncbi:MAG TPA: hypothetical protein DCG54_01510, partial [Anaerolineae bacterium]|nr:hypothetical protein [Anaerolineae bacterium]